LPSFSQGRDSHSTNFGALLLITFSQGRYSHSTNFGALLLIKILVSSVAIPIKILLVSSVLRRYSYFGCRPPSPQTALSTAPITALGSNRTACMPTEAPPTLSRRPRLGWDRTADCSSRAAFYSDPTAHLCVTNGPNTKGTDIVD
jgi:hypothetical protein